MKLRILSAARLSLPLASALVALLSAQSAHAQSWSGTTSGTWSNTNNWTDGVEAGSKTTTTDTDIAVFNVSAQPTIVINMNASGGVYYLGAIDNTNATTRTFSNSSTIAPGILTLNGATVNSVENTILRNSTTTLMTIKNGTGLGTLGLALGNATNNIIQITGTGGVTISSIISGSGRNLTLEGGGTGVLTLSGANSYTGETTVSVGKLTVSTGSINGTSSVTIGTASTAAITEFNYNSSTALTQSVSFAAGSTGGTLSGNSTINQAVNVITGNTLAIGNSIGVMNFGSHLGVGGTYLYELTGGGTTADLGDVAGNLTLGGNLDLVQLGTYTVGNKFTLFAYDGTLAGLFKDSGGVTTISDDTNFTDAGGIWRMNYNDTTAGLNGGVSGSSKYVTITAIPELNVSAILSGLGMLLLLRRRL
jgi:hypothetical protein